MQSSIVTFSSFMQFSKLVHFTATKKFGSMMKDGKPDEDHLTQFLSQVGIKREQLVLMEQVHGDTVTIVENTNQRIIPSTDGLITKQNDVYLGVLTADCIPVFFYDKEKKIIGISHAGYKGLLSHIIDNMVHSFQKLGSEPKDLIVGLGPSIGACCYNVPQERIEQFKAKFPLEHDIFEIREDKYFLDLKKICTRELVRNGIPEMNIEISPYCTSTDNDLFFSYRKEGPERYGEFLSVIGMV